MRNPPALVLGATAFFTPEAFIISDGNKSGEVTFTRASDGTYFDALGILQTVGSNIARVHYIQDGTTDFGLFIEGSAENICLQSEDLSTTWTNVNSSESVDMAVSPENTFTADELIVDTGVTVPHAIEQTYTGSTVNDFCGSIFVKQSTHTDMYLRLSDAADTDFIDIIVDLSDGTILQAATATGGNASVTDGGVVTLGNGWYRVWISGICDNTLTAHKMVVGISQDTTISYTGNGTDSIFVWGGQIEQASIPSSYVATTTVAVTRAADVATVDLTAVSWFSATEGTIFIDFKRETEVTGVTTMAFQIDDGDVNDSIRVEQSSTSKQVESNVTDATVSQVSIVSSTGDANIRAKLAFAHKANDFASSLNGAAVGTDTSGTVPTTGVNLRIGYSETGQELNGVIRELHYYDTRLIDATLVTLTT